MSDFLAKIDALIAEDRESENVRSEISRRENDAEPVSASEWEKADEARIQLLDKAMLLLFQVRPTIEAAEAPRSPWPVTDEERVRFVDWQSAIDNGETAYGFRDWFDARKKEEGQ